MSSCENYYDDHLEEKFHVRDLGAKKIFSTSVHATIGTTQF